MIKPILQVEDSSDDARLTELAFRKAGITNSLITLSSASERSLIFAFRDWPSEFALSNDGLAVVTPSDVRSFDK